MQGQALLCCSDVAWREGEELLRYVRLMFPAHFLYRVWQIQRLKRRKPGTVSLQSLQTTWIGKRFVLKNWSSLPPKQARRWDEVYWAWYTQCHSVVPMALVGTERDSTEFLVQKRSWRSGWNSGMGDLQNVYRCSGHMLEIPSRSTAKLAGALRGGEDGEEGLQPWQALGSAQVSPFEEVAFCSTKQHLSASVPVWTIIVSLSHVLVADLFQPPWHLQSVSASQLEFGNFHLRGCHFL